MASPSASGSAAPSASAAPSVSAAASGSAATSPPDSPRAPARPTLTDVAQILFADASDFRAPWAQRCTEALPDDARVRCLFDVRYAPDARAASVAHGLFVRHGIVSGVEVAHRMDGGYRGLLEISPAVPRDGDRRHLTWLEASFADFERFFGDLEKGAAPLARYRYRPITLRFMRSKKCEGATCTPARTPSAYAHHWTIAYHLDGSLHTSEDAVRETMFHEIFHLNDQAHGDWSDHGLGPTFDAIVKKCGVRASCLAPYAPNDTMVKGGTYYAFQPGNGVREYAAELAVRYYREERAALRGEKLGRARFKCGPAENVAAWDAFVAEFFGGIDRAPPCP